MNLNISKYDEIIMRLVHYFVTKEGYQPVLVNGLENEIWLENLDKDYEIIRINSNHIHNNEQLEYDKLKAKSVAKQIKKKTFSFKISMLTILLDVDESVEITDDKNNKILYIDDIKDVTDGRSKLSRMFPSLKDDDIDATDAMDFFINVTNDINKSTEKKTMLYEKTFGKKTPIITYILIIVNVIIFLLEGLGILNSNYFSMNATLVKSGEWWRIFTSAFFHGGVVHLLCNMYSLYAIGTQLEMVVGKRKYATIYFISIITSSLLSGVINGGNTASIGASGAIFGLLGALLYFGLHYRLYLGNELLYNIIPVILLNLFIGFSLPYIDNWGHLGGLVGGYLSCMMVGIEGKSTKNDQINGLIVTILLIAFLTYMLLVY